MKRDYVIKSDLVASRAIFIVGFLGLELCPVTLASSSIHVITLVGFFRLDHGLLAIVHTFSHTSQLVVLLAAARFLLHLTDSFVTAVS